MKRVAIVLEQFNYLRTHSSTGHSRNDECSVPYKSAEIILNGTIILCNLSFVFFSRQCVREMVVSGKRAHTKK